MRKKFLERLCKINNATMRRDDELFAIDYWQLEQALLDNNDEQLFDVISSGGVLRASNLTSMKSLFNDVFNQQPLQSNISSSRWSLAAIVSIISLRSDDNARVVARYHDTSSLLDDIDQSDVHRLLQLLIDRDSIVAAHISNDVLRKCSHRIVDQTIANDIKRLFITIQSKTISTSNNDEKQLIQSFQQQQRQRISIDDFSTIFINNQFSLELFQFIIKTIQWFNKTTIFINDNLTQCNIIDDDDRVEPMKIIDEILKKSFAEFQDFENISNFISKLIHLYTNNDDDDENNLSKEMIENCLKSIYNFSINVKDFKIVRFKFVLLCCFFLKKKNIMIHLYSWKKFHYQ
jgi:hypothetical protein